MSGLNRYRTFIPEPVVVVGMKPEVNGEFV